MKPKNEKIANRFTELFSSHQFIKSGQLFCRINDGIAFCVQFQTTSLIYVDFFLLPLYIPADFRYMSYGNRLELFTDYRIPPLDPSVGASEKDAWVQDAMTCFEKELIPFFDSVCSVQKLSAYFKETKQDLRFFFCPAVQFEELRAYTFFASQDQNALHDSLDLAMKQLRRVNFWTEAAKQSHKEELQTVEKLSNQPKDVQGQFLSDTISHTVKTCLPKKISEQWLRGQAPSAN